MCSPLLSSPAWRQKDLGKPLPKDAHACSVCLPTWQSVLGYEQGLEKILSHMRTGYPRFLLAPHTQRLFLEAQKSCAAVGKRAIVFPSRDVAQRALHFVEKHSRLAAQIASFEGLQVLVVAEKDYPLAMQYWRYTGEIVSSRQSQDIIEGDKPPSFEQAVLKELLASFICADAKDLFLYESGMSACFAVHRACQNRETGKKTLQIEFPYVDALRLQRSFGSGVVFLAQAEGEALEEALRRIEQGEFSAVFCEMPTNPLLRTPPIEALAKVCRVGGCPLVIDDSAVSPLNIDVSHIADVVVTSLTKWASGKGNVMAGQVHISPQSPLYAYFQSFFTEDTQVPRLYSRDAQVLWENAASMPKRIEKSNATGERLAAYLSLHPAIERVFYPQYENKHAYDKVKREYGGYGGLFSFLLKNPRKTPAFYNAMVVSKGPSFGTDFSLLCPYALLAHYEELDWALDCGVSQHLLRFSVGQESFDVLKERFDNALDAI